MREVEKVTNKLVQISMWESLKCLILNSSLSIVNFNHSQRLILLSLLLRVFFIDHASQRFQTGAMEMMELSTCPTVKK